jgi:predicted nucleic acid-binding protein
LTQFVLEASVAAVWLLDDEQHSGADAALSKLEEYGAIVPQLWHAEIRNCLLVAERRGRISGHDVDDRLKALNELPIQTDAEPDHDHALQLARKHKLSLYDALYLELALRKNTSLCSLDKTLVRAAGIEGVG